MPLAAGPLRIVMPGTLASGSWAGPDLFCEDAEDLTKRADGGIAALRTLPPNIRLRMRPEANPSACNVEQRRASGIFFRQRRGLRRLASSGTCEPVGEWRLFPFAVRGWKAAQGGPCAAFQIAKNV